MASLSSAIRSQSQQNREICEIRANDFERTLDLLTLSTTFYDVSVLCNLFLKAEMRQFGASGNQRI